MDYTHQMSYTPKREKSGKMLVVRSTEEAIVQVARALESLGSALDSHETRIQENAGLVEEMLGILYLLDKRVAEISKHVGMEEVEQFMEEVKDV